MAIMSQADQSSAINALYGGGESPVTGSGPITTSPAQFIGTAGTPGTGGVSNGFSLSNLFNASPLGFLVNGGATALTQASVNTLSPAVTAVTNAITGNNTAAPHLGSTSTISNAASTFAAYFVRGGIVVLGMIFVAVGLAMFGYKQPVVIQNLSNNVKKVTGKT